MWFEFSLRNANGRCVGDPFWCKTQGRVEEPHLYHHRVTPTTWGGGRKLLQYVDVYREARWRVEADVLWWAEVRLSGDVEAFTEALPKCHMWDKIWRILAVRGKDLTTSSCGKSGYGHSDQQGHGITHWIFAFVKGASPLTFHMGNASQLVQNLGNVPA